MNFLLAHPFLFGDSAAPGTRAFLIALMLLAGLILLAACANLGGLFAARAADRSRELALLTSVIGGAAGLWSGTDLLSGLSIWQPVPKYSVHMAVYPDMAMLGLLATWIPAQRALSLDPSTLLREE